MSKFLNQITPLHIISILVLGVASASHLLGMTQADMFYSFVGGAVLGVGGALASKK